MCAVLTCVVVGVCCCCLWFTAVVCDCRCLSLVLFADVVVCVLVLCGAVCVRRRCSTRCVVDCCCCVLCDAVDCGPSSLLLCVVRCWCCSLPVLAAVAIVARLLVCWCFV